MASRFLIKPLKRVIHRQIYISRNGSLFRNNIRYFSSIEEVRVPNLGDSISEGTIISIHKSIGEQVKTDEVVLEIETDKVSIDVRAPKDGYIAKYFVEESNDVEVGAPLYALSDKPIDGIDPSSIKPSESPKKDEATSSNDTTSKPSETKTVEPKKEAKTIVNNVTSRIPMIKFKYGKRDEINALLFGNNMLSSDFDDAIDNEIPKGIPFFLLPKKYSRTAWTDIEINAVNTGGAVIFD